MTVNAELWMEPLTKALALGVLRLLASKPTWSEGSQVSVDVYRT